MEGGAAGGRRRIGADEHVDAAPAFEGAVRPDAFDDNDVALHAVEGFGVDHDLAAPIADARPGAAFDAERLRRVGMDYLDTVDMTRHDSWDAYLAQSSGRLILLTTRAGTAYTRFAYRADDTLLLGRESAGVPDHVHDAVDARIVIPMAPGARSLNVVVAGAMVLGEALRQTDEFPRRAP